LLSVHGLEPLLRRSYLPEELRESTEVPLPFANREDYDLHRLTEALGQTEGNVTRAARLIGISRPRAYRLMQWQKVKREPKLENGAAPHSVAADDPEPPDG
jgi:transcriptional regulator of acetoin/glycerol metabolism